MGKGEIFMFGDIKNNVYIWFSGPKELYGSGSPEQVLGLEPGFFYAIIIPSLTGPEQ